MTGDIRVVTTGGVVRGTVEGAVRRFSGVPFALVPARFRRPIAATWQGEFDATHWGPAPWQSLPAYDDPAAPFDEDCLNLAVWAPKDVAETLPVLVWVYGGGFEFGSNAAELTRGDALAASGDMIVVALNYRVGALGWAELSHLGGPLAEASNLGLHDIVSGLEWIQQNIASFGGDPERVTVLGESAGSFALCALLGAPRADGLFSALAAFSGCASRIIPLDEAQNLGTSILHSLDADPLTATPDQWVAAQRRMVPFDIGVRNAARPRALGVVDDSSSPVGLLGAHPLAAVRAGTWGERRMLIGTTRDEAANFPAPDGLTREMLEGEVVDWTGNPRARDLVGAYVAESSGLADARRRILTDWVYRLPSVRLADAVAANDGRAYLSITGRSDGRPAPHGIDVPGLFNRTAQGDSPAAASRAAEITDAVRRFVHDDLDWPCLTPGPGDLGARSFGEPGFDAGAAYGRVRERWLGFERP